MNAEDLLFLLYTSGTTAKPKGIKHTTAGYLTQRDDDAPARLRSQGRDRRLLVHGRYRLGDRPLVHRLRPAGNGATSVIYEGTPDYPDKDRFWEIVERYGVTILYTAPTAIRTFMKWGPEYPAKHDLSSLRLLGTVGEPINPEAWIWYREYIGGNRTPVVDTWWQTETGAIMISAAARHHDADARQRDQAAPRHRRRHRQRCGRARSARAAAATSCSRGPWPGMLRGIWGDDERYEQTYWSKFPHRYFAGDGCHRDADGNYWFMGRIDDVMNVSGHRISTTEVESALVDHPSRRRSRRLRQDRRRHRAGDLRLRLAQSGPGRIARTGRRSPRARRGQARQVHSSEVCDVHARNCRRRAAARSCGGSCAISPRAEPSATPRRWPTLRSSTNSRSAPESRPHRRSSRSLTSA